MFYGWMVLRSQGRCCLLCRWKRFLCCVSCSKRHRLGFGKKSIKTVYYLNSSGCTGHILISLYMLQTLILMVNLSCLFFFVTVSGDQVSHMSYNNSVLQFLNGETSITFGYYSKRRGGTDGLVLVTGRTYTESYTEETQCHEIDEKQPCSYRHHSRNSSTH